jgi:putative DNA primase/helicase
MSIVIKKKSNANQLGADVAPGTVIEFPAALAGPAVELTEDAVAEAFAQKYADELRFDHTNGKWFVWTGHRWQQNDTQAAFDFARHLCREQRHGQRIMGSKKAAEGVEHMARRDQRLAVTADNWDRNPLLLGTPGGTVDLKTGTLNPPSRKDFITKLTAVTPAAKPDCPLFRKFLGEATGGDEQLQQFLQQWAGYCLTGDTREHALLFIYGPGGNGKSLLQSVMIEILGNYAQVAAMETFAAKKHASHLTELAMLNGARLVAVSETEYGQAWSERRINQFTGGDKITANFMHRDMFTYTPQLKLLVIGNHKPKITTVNDAARRRFNIVPFMHKPKEPDMTLLSKLRTEFPAILRWMVEGCLNWQQHGLTRPEIVGKATGDYFEEQDLLGRWIEERCNTGVGLKAGASDLYKSWSAFAANNGENAGSSVSFAERMTTERGFEKKKSGAMYYAGIELKKELAMPV